MQLKEIFFKIFRFECRYPEDVLDRFWFGGYQPNSWTNISTLETIPYNDRYKLPSAVMRTACTPKNTNDSLDILWEPRDSTLEFYFFIHFTEIEELQPGQFREFDVFSNGQLLYGPISPTYLWSTLTIANVDPVTGGLHNYSLSKTRNSTLPPIINAFELYTVKEFLQVETDQQDGA